MATWSSQVKRVLRYEWTVPTPAVFTQVQQVFHIAQQERRKVLRLPDNAPPWDTDLTVDVGDDEVIVWFEHEEDLPGDTVEENSDMKSMRTRPTGMYRLYWRGGGSSVAAVGELADGRRWFAPVNWTAITPSGIASTDWRKVARAELLHVPEPAEHMEDE